MKRFATGSCVAILLSLGLLGCGKPAPAPAPPGGVQVDIKPGSVEIDTPRGEVDVKTGPDGVGVDVNKK